MHATIDKHEKALWALRKAFELNKRQDWIAVRLARKSVTRENPEEAIKLLRECLNYNPASKIAHLELAKLLIHKADPEERALILEHLKRSFTEGDASFDAQFWYARELFLASNYQESDRLFQSLKHAPIDPKIRHNPRAFIREPDSSLTHFQGRVRQKEATFILIQSSTFQPLLLAHLTGSQPRHFSATSNGCKVEFGLGFSMEGPRAVSIRPIK